MAGANSLRTIFYALGANFALAVAKAVAAVMTKSGAMLAESIHSFADCGNQLLLLMGMKFAKRAPTADFPLGYGKAIYFWSFIVALILFTMGGVFSLYEGWHKLHHSEPLSYPWIAIGVLVFGLIVEGISMRACVMEVNKVRGGRSFFQWFRESRQSELIVIFGEDLAALTGLALALVAVVLTMITGDPMYDALGTLSIGLLLIVVAGFIAKEVHDLLVGQSVAPPVRRDMLAFLEGHGRVDKVFNLLTLQLGPEVMVAVKARMVPCDTPAELIDAINQVEREFQQRFPQTLWSFFEPDNQD